MDSLSPLEAVQPPPLAADKGKSAEKIVVAAILAEEARLRAAHPILRFQDSLALLIWVFSLSWMGISAYLYISGRVPWYFTFFTSSFAASLLHELEHDVIHSMYFSGNPLVWNAMFLGIWIAKLSLNPWTRKTYHLHHHRRSGQEDDVEERLLGLGVGNLPLRLALAVFPWLAVLFFHDITVSTKAANEKFSLRYRGAVCSGERWLQRAENLMIISPTVAALVWLCSGSAAARAGAATFLVVWGGPNVLRHASIALMSSFSHYYGDLTPNDVTQQNQILNHSVFLPLQLFCCNFGAEHIIHHFVVSQPFWIRHLVRHAAWAAMVQIGTRVNDFGSIFYRAQRYRRPGDKDKGA
jgi:fatty acid desaturase